MKVKLKGSIFLMVMSISAVPVLYSCATPSDRAETRQETRVEGRTEERQERRRGF